MLPYSGLQTGSLPYWVPWTHTHQGVNSHMRGAPSAAIMSIMNISLSATPHTCPATRTDLDQGTGRATDSALGTAPQGNHQIVMESLHRLACTTP